MTAISQLQAAEVVTADIWDTVLRRTCHPEALKRYSAGLLAEELALNGHSVRNIHQTRLAIESSFSRSSASGEFTLSQVMRAWVRVYAPQLSDSAKDALADKLLAAECAKELEVTYADAEAVALLRSLPRRPYFLSDYYCGIDHINALLEKVGLADVFEDGLVSCDVDASKRQGKLFDIARQRWGLSQGWAHFGDHPYSDVAQARAHGAHGVLWTTAETQLLGGKTRRYLAREKTGALEWGLGPLAVGDTPWLFGQKLAPLLASYCRRVAKHARTHEAAQVLFLAREGIFLSKVFGLQETLPYVVLDVSRRATFAASLARNLDAGLHKMWRQYAHQSPAAFCMTLNAPKVVFEPLFQAAGFEWDRTIDGIATDPAVQELFRSDEFASALNNHVKSEADALRGYLAAQMGEVPQPGKTYVVADVGWKGTIQDNLARLFPESRWVGVYCGLVPVAQEPANLKVGDVVDAHRDSDWPTALKQTLPFELMFNASQGSTTGYENDSSNGWVPVYDHIPGESVVHFGFTHEVQAGCLAALSKLNEEVQQQAVSDVELWEVGRALWLAVQEAPPACLVDAAYQLEHNESFGVGGAVTFRRDFTWRELWHATRNREARAAISGWLMRMPWRKVVLRQKRTTIATKVALVLYELRQRVR